MEIEPRNNTNNFFKKLELEGKCETLDKPHHLKSIDEQHKTGEDTKRESKYKQAKSEESARNCHVGPTHYNPIKEDYFS